MLQGIFFVQNDLGILLCRPFLVQKGGVIVKRDFRPVLGEIHIENKTRVLFTAFDFAFGRFAVIVALRIYQELMHHVSVVTDLGGVNGGRGKKCDRTPPSKDFCDASEPFSKARRRCTPRGTWYLLFP